MIFRQATTTLLWLLLTTASSTTAFSTLPAMARKNRAAVVGFSSARCSQLSTSLYASSQEEDLELTRQIIRQHEERLAAGAVSASTTAADISDNTADPATSSSKSPSPVVETPKPTMTASEMAAANRKARSFAASPKDSKRPANDLMIRAAFGEAVEQTPIWLFRQAGRHLPEYEQYKKDQGKNFLELLQDPACVAECTLQPVRRYDLDAAILFSDILVIAEALNIDVTMPGGVGIQVPQPLVSPDEVESRLPKLASYRGKDGSNEAGTAGTAAFVQDKLGHVIEAVRQIRTALDAESKSIPLIGFSAAPWTLLYYMVGGSSKKNTDIGVQWLEQHPWASQKLLDLLTDVVIEYMSAQVVAGAHMLQVFEAMGMMIDDDNFERYALPCLKQIASTLSTRHPDVPLMVFCRGACHLNHQLTNLGFHVVTMDGTVDRATARASVGPDITLQGNYDPAELIEANGKTAASVRDTARTMLHELGPTRLIANLGEGLGGKESPALVDAFVTAIHEESLAMLQAR